MIVPDTAVRLYHQELRELRERPDWIFIDGGVKAPDASNRIRGALRKMIEKMVSGEIPRGTPILVASIDRMVRDFPGIAKEFLTKLADAGFPIIEADGMIWDWEATITSSLILEMKVSIAYITARTLRGYTTGANEKKHAIMAPYHNEADGDQITDKPWAAPPRSGANAAQAREASRPRSTTFSPKTGRTPTRS